MNSSTPDIFTQTYLYDWRKLTSGLAEILQENLPPEVWEWLKQTATQADNEAVFTSVFVQLPRKVARSVIIINEEGAAFINTLVPGFTVQGWTTDRLCRVWLLLQADVRDKDAYTRRMENLFEAAEMNEQVALYSALPLLAYPEHWQKRCSEGIRSNIGDVLQAIMCRNPYPSNHLAEAAWNQMVLKAFFTEKQVAEIIGLDDRANPELASILLDYAHERWAAHRSVNPQLWRCVGKFMAGKNVADIQRLFHSDNATDRAAAALACNDSSYTPAKILLDENASLKQSIETGSLTWNTLS